MLVTDPSFCVTVLETIYIVKYIQHKDHNKMSNIRGLQSQKIVIDRRKIEITYDTSYSLESI